MQHDHVDVNRTNVDAVTLMMLNKKDIPMATSSTRLAVAIATRGRPAVLAETLSQLRMQRRVPDLILVTYPAPQDVGDAPTSFPEVRFLQSAPGLTTQRNTSLSQLDGYDLVTFLDDDFWMAPDYLGTIEAVLSAHPCVMAATGHVLADGINGPGFDLQQARVLLQSAPVGSGKPTFKPVFNVYGCNMTLRLSPIHAHTLRFDEMLPLYGWYEDVEFSRQLAKFGTIIRVDQAYGVHLGVKSGRQSGRRLGYSQVANPVYLARKGSVGWTYAIASMTSRSLKNLVYSVRPEPTIDRRGRLSGNVQAWRELLLGGLHPMRILGL